LKVGRHTTKSAVPVAGLGLAIGAGIGLVVGLVVDGSTGLLIGLASGASIGLIVGAAFETLRSDRHEST
jgi:hypothetical protein